MNLREYIMSDLYRYTGKISFKMFLKTYLSSVGFNYLVWFRIAQKYNNIFFRLILKKKMIKFGIEIHPLTKIGYGFYIGHFGGIVINEQAVIGNNCNISHGITIGQINIGDKQGTPIIGDRVYIGPGAKIIGRICIGDDAAIGANAVVTKDVETHTSVGGIPAKELSKHGSVGYINRVWKNT